METDRNRFSFLKLSQEKISLFSFFFLILLFIISFLISQLASKRIIFRNRASGVGASFSFDPSTLEVSPGQEFLISVRIDTAGQQTSGASIQLAFDKTAFEALEATPGKNFTQTPPMFPTVLRNKIENSTGKIYLDAGVEIGNPQYYAGEGIFGKIKFKVNNQASVGSKSLSFLLSNPNNPKILGDCDILGMGEQASQDLLSQLGSLTIGVVISPNPSPTFVPTSTPNPSTSPSQPSPTPLTTVTPSPLPTSLTPTTTPLPSATSTPRPTLPPTSSSLVADLSGPNNQKDNRIDLYDFNALMIHWGETKNIRQFDLSGPQNQPDGKIDFYDLAKVLVYWTR